MARLSAIKVQLVIELELFLFLYSAVSMLYATAALSCRNLNC